MRAAKFIFRAVVVLIWLFVAFVIIDRIGQELDFARSMGGIYQ